MTRLAFGESELIARWVAMRTGMDYDADFGPCAAIAVLIGDELAAAVAYTHHDPKRGNVHMSIAATTPRWATRGTIRALLHYPFEQLRCRRVTALVRRKNKRCRRFLEGIGFRYEGNIRKGYGDDDCIVYGMLGLEAARWLD